MEFSAIVVRKEPKFDIGQVRGGTTVVKSKGVRSHYIGPCDLRPLYLKATHSWHKSALFSINILPF